MRILLDECADARLEPHLIGHEVATVPQAGWAGKKNGELLKLIQGRYDVFVTVDQNLPHQQNVAVLPFVILLLIPSSSDFRSLLKLVPQILSAVESARQGRVTLVGMPENSR